jgi:hypothetical protein
MATGLLNGPEDEGKHSSSEVLGTLAERGVQSLTGYKAVDQPRDERGKEIEGAKYMGAVANMLGAGFVPGVGVVSMAERKLAAATLEGLMATGAGLWSIEAGEIARDQHKFFGVSPERAEKIGQAIGGFLGPVATSMGRQKIQQAGMPLARWLRERVGGLSKESQIEAAGNVTTKAVSEGLRGTPNAEGNIRETMGLQEKIPGFEPTLGQASDAAGIAAIEKRLATESPEALIQAKTKEHNNIIAIERFKEEKFPHAKEFFPAAFAKHTRVEVELERKAAKVTRDLESLASTQERYDNANIGSRLRAQRDSIAESVRSDAEKNYSATYELAESLGTTVNMNDVRKFSVSVLNSDSESYQKLPTLLHEIIADAAKKGPETVSFQKFHSLYKEVNAGLNAATLSHDYKAQHHLMELKNLLKGKIAAWEESGTQLGTLFKQANEFWENKYAKVFREGLGGKMDRANRYGDITDDSKIVRSLVLRPGSARGVEEFSNIYGANPESATLLRNGILDAFAEDVVRAGEISPVRVETFLRKYNATLSHPLLTGLKQQLIDTGARNSELLARRASIHRKQKLLDKTALAKIAKGDAETALTQALSDKRYLDSLINSTRGNPRAQQALIRSIANKVSEMPAPLDYVVKNEATLRPALNRLGPGHYENLVTISKAQRVLRRSPTPDNVSARTYEDAVEQATGTGTTTLLNRLLNYKYGFGGRKWLTIVTGGKYLFKVQREEVERLIRESIYDPDLAKILVQMNERTAPKDSTIKSLGDHAWSHGIRIISFMSQDQGDDDGPN